MKPSKKAKYVSLRHYARLDHPGNSAEYHTGKQCIEAGCKEPAGTWWSHLWCVRCNIKRMDAISRNLADMCERMGLGETYEANENDDFI